MNIVCGITAHNEDWILGYTARATLSWCDTLVVLDHCSTDNTSAVLADIQDEFGRTRVIRETDPVFHPLRYYRRLAEEAKRLGGTHLAIVDADEMVSGNMLERLRSTAAALTMDEVCEMPWVPMVSLHERDYTGPRAEWKTGFLFCQLNGEYESVPDGACDIHRSRIPLNVTRLVPVIDRPEQGGFLHLAYIDRRRLLAKIVWWKMLEMLRWPGRRTPQWLNDYYIAPVGDGVQVPSEWYEPYQKYEQYVHVGGVSEVEKAARILWTANSARFSGLTTFGLFD